MFDAVRWRTLRVAAVLTLVSILSSSILVAAKQGPPLIKDRSEVEVQILALNDFHGNLLPPSGSSGRVGTTLAGGAEYLSTHVQDLKATNANSIVVSAGDLIGASPLLSALFHDEPTIEAMNLIGLDLNAVGNHEFDEGTTELLRMQNGGCHPTDGCLDGTGFAGADFQFLAANVVNHASGDTLFAPYTIKNFNGAKVAFIGMTLEGTPNIVSPSGVAGFDFLDEADTVNALIPEIQAQDVEAIVVLLHEGGLPASLNINGCNGVTGAVVDIAERMDDAVDLIISGHTHQPYSCVFGGIPVTSAFSFGRLVTDIDMRVDRASKDVTSLSINNRIVTRDVPLDQRITDLIAHYNAFAAPIANRVVGHITADLTLTNDDSKEQAMGNVIADAQQAATAPLAFGGAVAAFMNAGGVRSPGLVYASSPAGEGDGVVTYGEVFTAQPFGNSLVTMTLTGTQIDRFLEEQFCGVNSPLNGGFAKVALPSTGFHYTWDASEAGAANCDAANAVDPSLITIGGVALDLGASYRITVNSFMADGGDGFTVLKQGTNRLGGAVDTDALEAWFAVHEPAGISPPALDRIDVVP
ncbi:MAG TPA: bifunctional metallophosphatase/5'-nucleotidase [Candidatus Limnocylindria bacterium]|nr:bifunctional metallophosphatase/5'-nucleotidase [Candidatus Limnocylindria bacterium]